MWLAATQSASGLRANSFLHWEAPTKSPTQSEFYLAWGICAAKVSIPLEGKVPSGDKGPGREGKAPIPTQDPLVHIIHRGHL